MSFEVASRVERLSDGLFRAQIPDGWQQGRGAFGGLVVGVLARAAIASEGDVQRSLRSVTADIFAPVLPGPADVRIEVLRRGKNLTSIDARLIQGGALLARASVALGTPRKTSLAHVPALAPPTTVDWNSLPTIPIGAPMGPVFAHHYEYRSSGPMPMAGGGKAETTGFVREKACTTPLDAPAVIALLDAFWPAIYSVETQFHSVATVSFSAELLLDPRELSPAEPLQHVARLAGFDAGYMTEFRELWCGQRLVAMNQQVMALLP
jgi:Thioesterase-like superfamily